MSIAHRFCVLGALCVEAGLGESVAMKWADLLTLVPPASVSRLLWKRSLDFALAAMCRMILIEGGIKFRHCTYTHI